MCVGVYVCVCVDVCVGVCLGVCAVWFLVAFVSEFNKFSTQESRLVSCFLIVKFIVNLCRDLKRDFLENLERRTQKAIVELIRKLILSIVILLIIASSTGERLMEDDGAISRCSCSQPGSNEPVCDIFSVILVLTKMISSADVDAAHPESSSWFPLLMPSFPHSSLTLLDPLIHKKRDEEQLLAIPAGRPYLL